MGTNRRDSASEVSPERISMKNDEGFDTQGRRSSTPYGSLPTDHSVRGTGLYKVLGTSAGFEVRCPAHGITLANR